MSGDTEIDDPEVSDGASENEYSDQEHEPDVVDKEDDNTDMAEQKFRPDGEENGKAAGTTVTTKPKLDPKDPLRPRRKKARRACFACQRAHLTCGMFAFLQTKVILFVSVSLANTPFQLFSNTYIDLQLYYLSSTADVYRR